MNSQLFVVIAVLMVASLVLAACGPTATEAPAPEATEAPAATQAPAATAAPTEEPLMEEEMNPLFDPALLEGTIYEAGSSTVYPLALRLAEDFKAEGFTGEFKLDSIGSGAGFERFCKNAETDISNASRPIKDSEVEACRANGREPVEFLVGLDAIAVVVSAENDFATDLTVDQLGAIFTGEVTKWSEVDPSFPNEAIELYSPGTDSGTFDFFVEEIVQKPRKIEKLDEAKTLVLAANPQTSEDDNVLVQGVEGSPYAIGYFGYAYFAEDTGGMKALSINGILPSLESAESGTYKLARPLFIYSDAQIMNDKPQVAAFINYFLANVGEVIDEVGYFPASQEKIDGSIVNWLEAMK